MKRRLLLVSAFCIQCWFAFGQEVKPFNYFPLSLETRRKIEKLISEMSVEEKAHQLASFYPNGNKRLNIPHMQAGEALHGIVSDGTTSFPSAIAMGSTWDTTLVERESTIIAQEARALGIHQVYTPCLGWCAMPAGGVLKKPTAKILTW
jgi:beta-glucosidase-like glycosyl hydrolase